MDNEMKELLKKKDTNKMTSKELEEQFAKLAELDEDIKLCEDVIECLLK